MIERINSKTIDATASRKPKSLKIDKIYEKAIESKLERCLKKHILALGKSMNHCNRSMFMFSCNILNFCEVRVHSHVR